MYNIDYSLSKQFGLLVINTQDRSLLAGCEMIQPTFFRVKPMNTYIILQKLAGTQRFFYKDKRVMCDFFSKLTLEYIVEETTVHALLNMRELTEYDLILQGSPHIALFGNALYFLDPDIGWQEVFPFLGGPKKMSREEYIQFKKNIDPARITEFEAPKTKPCIRLVDASCSFVLIDDPSLEPALIRAGFTKKELGKSNYYCPTDRSQQAIVQLIQAGCDVRDDRDAPIVLSSRSDIALQEKTFRLSGTIFFGNSSVSVQEVASRLHKHDRLMPLDNGSTGLLAFDSEVKDILMHVELVGMSLKKSHIAKTGEISLPEHVRALIEPAKRIECKPAHEFTGTLRPYQQDGLNWIVSLYRSGCNGLLADEMGLGKTVQVIAFLSLIQGKTLVVVPTSLQCNWQREIDHFLPAKQDITIISYGMLRSNIAELSKQEYECLILDEAQVIKNSSTITHQAVLQLKSRFKLSLTGTPVENSHQELINHFNFLEPGLILDDTPSALRSSVAPFFLRRKKADVAKDLPERVDEAVFVTMTETQEELYKRFMINLKAGLLKKIDLEGTKACRMEIFEAILRLRQIACHPLLVPQLIDNLNPNATTSGKFDLVLEDLETLIAEEKKVVIFSQFTSMLQLFCKEAKSRDWGHLLLEGQTQNRQALVDTFQNDASYPLFFISLKAGGVGLNLTRADYVLLYDPWWNRAVEAQAIDRAHRIGRKTTVFSKRYYVKGSIEEKILTLQDKKSHIADMLLEENGAATPTLDDLHELLV